MLYVTPMEALWLQTMQMLQTNEIKEDMTQISIINGHQLTLKFMFLKTLYLSFYS